MAKLKWGFGLPDQVVLQPATRPGRQPGAGGTWSHLRGDLVGGFAAAVLTIPISMGYGLLAFSSLGEALMPQAILAGLYAPVCGCLVALLLGARTTMIYSPRSVVTFLISSLVMQNLVRSDLPFLQTAPAGTLLTLALAIIMLAGLIQAGFGWLRLGTLVKYVPAPVLAGFQNAAAILILFSQLDAMMGFKHHVAPHDLWSNLGVAQPLTLAVGIFTCTLILNAARVTRRIPPTILGLIGGVGLYYGFALAGFGDTLGGLVGSIPFALPSLQHVADLLALARSPDMLKLLPTLVAAAFSLAIVASLDGMLCARLVQADSGNKVHSNQELVRLGLGNAVAAAFGGIANGINLGSSFANHRSGARTCLSVAFHAVFIALAILSFTSLIAYLPRVVMAAMLVVIAIQLFDRWTFRMLRQLATGTVAGSRSMVTDLAIIAVVTVTAVAVNIVAAVFIGIGVTVMVFLRRISKSVVRRTYRCDTVQSRKTREPKTADLLAAHGAMILVVELEGPLFFGTAEDFNRYLEHAIGPDVAFVVLDVKRAVEIDSTGAKVLAETQERLRRQDKSLQISGVAPGSHVANVLDDMGITAALSGGGFFPDADRAIEWAEDRVIERFAGEAGFSPSELASVESGAEFPLRQMGIFAHMDRDELAVIRSLVERRAYSRGAIVFSEGDQSNELYVVAHGGASARLKLPGANRETRLAAFSVGTVFGELALLDRGARSATVLADDELVCYALTHDNFADLTERYPAIAIKLLSNLAREMSRSARRSTRTIYELAI
jgi:MFS superfamily sulfate permease-like transporter